MSTREDDRTALRQVLFWIPRWIAFLLVATAVLKLLSVMRTPVSQVRVDAVVSIFTNREVLLLASLFELVVAALLMRSRGMQMSAGLILYFSACASVYHLGLIFQGDHSCSCLGLATDWLGAGTTTVLSRATLVLFWILGLTLLAHTRKAVGTRPATRARCVLVGVAFIFTGTGPLPAVGATIAVEGEFTWITRRTNVDTRAFSVVFDETTLRITSSNPARPAGGPCVEIGFVDKEVVVIVLQCEDPNGRAAWVGVEINSADAAWALGNCRNSLVSWVFLTLRCSELFSDAQGKRQLASSSTTLGQPLGLVTEAHYTFSGGTDKTDLNCDVVISESLRKTWKKSPFLAPHRLERETLIEEERNLARYSQAFLLEEMRFSRFTNVAGVRFPMLAESTIFGPPRDKAGRSDGNRQPLATVKLALTNVTVLVNEAITLLPLNGPLTVSEGRLKDRKLHLQGCNYETNQLVTFEITPSARSAFEAEVQKAAAKRRTEQTKRLFTAMLAALVFGVPGAIYLFQRRKG